MPIEFRKVITRNMLRDERGKLFVFGDNLERKGLGGQAKEMRGEVNAIGLPTKANAGVREESYLRDTDLNYLRVANDWALKRIERHLVNGEVLVWPADHIGSGRAKLALKAPLIARYYRELLEDLVSRYGQL